ncbi:Uncharacterized protein DBV15_12488, partial [Temnothorax longispinosus]
MSRSIVEFEDGLQLVPSNWLRGTSECFWPTHENIKRLHKNIAECKELDDENWEIVKVVRIFGRAIPSRNICSSSNDERKTPFKNNQPSRHWWNNFCRRNPEVSSRVAQNLNMNRALVSEEALNSWFCEVKEYLKKLDLLDIDPSRVFNLDESAFFLVPKGDSVLARRGSKSVYKVVHGDEKESITVLFTVNAK